MSTVPTTQQQLESFARFATARILNDCSQPIEEVFFDWWTSQYRDDDRAAVEASLRDLQTGETGRSFDEFAKEFRVRNSLPESP